jgi:hypothetical protein
MHKLIRILIIAFAHLYLALATVRAQNPTKDQAGSLNYFSQIVSTDMEGENLIPSLKQTWSTKPGELKQIPIQVEKGVKYSVGIAGDYWVQSIQCRLVNDKGIIIGGFATERKAEERNIETLYFIPDVSATFLVQVMVNATSIPEALMAMIVAKEYRM